MEKGLGSAMFLRYINNKSKCLLSHVHWYRVNPIRQRKWFYSSNLLLVSKLSLEMLSN